jgi:hypothetical protein
LLFNDLAPIVNPAKFPRVAIALSKKTVTLLNLRETAFCQGNFPAKPPRYSMADKSKHTLVTLTQGFVDILINAKGEEVDLTHVEQTLSVSKRRLYDVTNVLAGIGVLERCGKARVRWIGNAAVPDSRGELQSLIARESEIDRLTSLMDESLSTLASSPDFQAHAWVTEEDVKRLGDDQMTLFALKGPPDLVVEVPEEGETGKHRLVCTTQSGTVDLIPIGAGRV